MANIQSISRGYRTSSYDAVFQPATGKTFVAGDLVVKTSATTVDTATLLDGVDKVVYMVVEGNDTYGGTITARVVCLSGIFETTVTDYATGSYSVDTALTATSGKFAPVSGTKKTIAHVVSFSLSQGLKVRMHN
jgi:hypothetical protein